MTGSQADFLARLKALLPPWFGDDETPILDAVLSGPAVAFAFIFGLIQYVRLQLRLATASDGFLDLFGGDFFGAMLPRNTSEDDDTYRARIKADLFPLRNTRIALTNALTNLTGIEPTIIEPWNPGDVGDVGDASRLAWSQAGVWGSQTMGFQCFVIAYVDPNTGVTPAQVYAAIEANRPLAVKVWTQIARGTASVVLATDDGTPLAADTGLLLTT